MSRMLIEQVKKRVVPILEAHTDGFQTQAEDELRALMLDFLISIEKGTSDYAVRHRVKVILDCAGSIGIIER